MGPEDATVILAAAIRNDAWWVRHYWRGGRMRPTASLAIKRQQALYKLGLTVRHAFSVSHDFEPLLVALCDGLRPHDEQPF